MLNIGRTCAFSALLVLGGCATNDAYEPFDPLYGDDASELVGAASSTFKSVEAPLSADTQLLMAPQDTSKYSLHETVPLAPLELYPYVLRVQELHDYYMSPSRPVPGGHNDRLRLRNHDVRQLFVIFGNRERARWQRHQLYQSKDTRCKNSRRGETKHCKDKLGWSEGYEVIPHSLQNKRRHFKDGPKIGPANLVHWVIGRAGKGTNTGHVKATAKYTRKRIDVGLESDKVALRRALEERSLPTDHVIDP